MQRFFCADFSTATLDGAEAHHALSVLRLEEEDKIALFNGKGKEAHARIVSIQGKSLKFEILHSSTTPTLPYTLRFAQAVTKTKSMDLILQKLTELGVSEIYPILSERSVVHLDQDSATAKLGKWQQLVLEACKQCGQNTLPNLHLPSAPATFFQQTQSLRSLKLIASLQPEARPIAQVLKSTREERPVDDVLVVIGPEGDFTPSEIGSARAHGFLPVSLGPLILRSETASIFTASVLAYELQKGSS